MNAGTFVLKTICSLEHSFPWRNFRSRDHSFPGTGTFIPWTVCSWELLFPRTNKPLTLLRALVVSKVDFCCLVLAGFLAHCYSGYSMSWMPPYAWCSRWGGRNSEHTTPLVRELHWLQVLERIQFWLCVLVYRCFNGTVPPYLAETLRQSTDVDARRRLRSAVTSTLITPSTRRVALGDQTEDSAVFIVIWHSRLTAETAFFIFFIVKCPCNSYAVTSFSISGPSLWNSLPLSVHDPSLTMTQFCTHLKTFLFCRAYCT